MLEQGERLGACFRRRLDEWGRARDKCDVSLWDKVQEAAEKKEEPSGSGKTQWKRDSKKAADLDSKMCKLLDEIKDDAKKKERLCTDLDEAMGTAFPDEWRTEQQQMGKEGKQTEDGAQTRKKARQLRLAQLAVYANRAQEPNIPLKLNTGTHRRKNFLHIITIK